MSRFDQKIGTFSKISATVASLSPSLIKLGGLFYRTSSLSLNTGTSGLGGLDTGTLSANTFYYVYSVVSGGVVYLIMSLSQNAPTGYAKCKKVGALLVGNGSEIFTTLSVNNDTITPRVAYTPTFQGFGSVGTILCSWWLNPAGLSMQGRFSPATSTAVEARIGTPIGLTTSGSDGSASRIYNGRWYRSISTGSLRKAGTFFANAPELDHLKFGSDDYTTAASPVSAFNGNVISPTDQIIYFSVTDINVTGWVGTIDWKDY